MFIQGMEKNLTVEESKMEGVYLSGICLSTQEKAESQVLQKKVQQEANIFTLNLNSNRWGQGGGEREKLIRRLMYEVHHVTERNARKCTRSRNHSRYFKQKEI